MLQYCLIIAMEKAFKQLQRDHYREEADKFDALKRRENRNHLNKIAAIARHLDIQKGDRVLEVGVGTGIHAQHLLKQSYGTCSYTGVDLSTDMLDVARKRLHMYPDIQLLEMDGEHLSFPDNTFDSVFISGTLHHLEDFAQGVAELIRVLKPGGRFCIMEPHYFFPTNMFWAHTKAEEVGAKYITRKNLHAWLKDLPVTYTLDNFAYTPPFPKALLPVFAVLDRMIARIPLLNRFSIMLFVRGTKHT